MSGDIGREDIRKKKTLKALHTALLSLLSNQNFVKITVTDICKEALISRATFYAYFLDKYELLQYWLTNIWLENMKDMGTYDQMEKAFNSLIHENESILKNLLFDVDNETLKILYDFILFTVHWAVETRTIQETDTKTVVLSNFYAGGMIFYLLWQIRNKFPETVPPMNTYLYELIGKFQTWKSEDQ